MIKEDTNFLLKLTINSEGYMPFESYVENNIVDLQRLKDSGILKQVIINQIGSTVDWFVANLEKGKING